MAAGLAMTAAALAASGARDAGRAGGAAQARAQAQDRDRAEVRASDGARGGGGGARGRERPPVRLVSAPVRIADAATVRLLRRGDRVDVIAAAAGSPPRGGRSPEARVVAAGVRVTQVPEAHETFADGGGGALVVLAVPRATAAELAGAGATSQLAVTLC
ncbi:RcpC/CpaB family pilus assembly protein [Streptomyces agglomeratus]